jgi:hypothetical protein
MMQTNSASTDEDMIKKEKRCARPNEAVCFGPFGSRPPDPLAPGHGAALSCGRGCSDHDDGAALCTSLVHHMARAHVSAQTVRLPQDLPPYAALQSIPMTPARRRRFQRTTCTDPRTSQRAAMRPGCASQLSGSAGTAVTTNDRVTRHIRRYWQARRAATVVVQRPEKVHWWHPSAHCRALLRSGPGCHRQYWLKFHKGRPGAQSGPGRERGRPASGSEPPAGLQAQAWHQRPKVGKSLAVGLSQDDGVDVTSLPGTGPGKQTETP